MKFKNCSKMLLCLALVAMPLAAVNVPHLTIEEAKTDNQRRWGLMQRRSLPDGYALLFSYPSAARPSIWSFNCLMDLAVLFLSQEGLVQEIAILKAYPEMMDPSRPVNSLKDMQLYPYSDSIVQFFLKHSVLPKKPCWHFLEMSIDSLQKCSIQVGDHIPLTPKQPR